MSNLISIARYTRPSRTSIITPSPIQPAHSAVCCLGAVVSPPTCSALQPHPPHVTNINPTSQDITRLKAASTFPPAHCICAPRFCQLLSLLNCRLREKEKSSFHGVELNTNPPPNLFMLIVHPCWWGAAATSTIHESAKRPESSSGQSDVVFKHPNLCILPAILPSSWLRPFFPLGIQQFTNRQQRLPAIPVAMTFLQPTHLRVSWQHPRLIGASNHVAIILFRQFSLVFLASLQLYLCRPHHYATSTRLTGTWHIQVSKLKQSPLPQPVRPRGLVNFRRSGFFPE